MGSRGCRWPSRWRRSAHPAVTVQPCSVPTRSTSRPCTPLRLCPPTPSTWTAPAGRRCPRRWGAITSYLYESNANQGGAFPTSAETDRVMDGARHSAAEFIGGEPDGIAFGANMTTLNFLLAHSVARTLEPGDEIIVTALDHDANISPWLLVARDHELTVRMAPIRSADATLDVDALEGMLGDRTAVVALRSPRTRWDPFPMPAASQPPRIAWARWPGPTACTWPRTGACGRELWLLVVRLARPTSSSAPTWVSPTSGPISPSRSPADRVSPADRASAPVTASRPAPSRTRPSRARLPQMDYLSSLGDGDLDTAFARIEAHERALTERFLDGLPRSRDPQRHAGHATGRRPSVRNRGLRAAGSWPSAWPSAISTSGTATTRPWSPCGPRPRGNRRRPGRLSPLHDRGRGRPPPRGAHRACFLTVSRRPRPRGRGSPAAIRA